MANDEVQKLLPAHRSSLAVMSGTSRELG